jgi:molybdate transport system substrate-binding protein
MHARRIILVTLLCITITAGVLVLVRAANTGTTLLVHAGAGIRPALDELGALFEKKTGTRVDYNYKGSACLLPDVCVSQKGDIYMPGELYFMQQAVDRKLVHPDYKIVATMTTVLIVQAGNPKSIKGLGDLTKPGIRLGLGDPQAVAIGRAARECLVKAGVWQQAQRNLVMSGQNVSELGNAVKLKQLDAAIVWDATAAMYGPKEIVTMVIPAEHTVCSPVPAAALKFTKNPREAQAYLDFLASAEATRVFVKHGFGPPPKPEAPCPPGRK